MSRFGAFWRFCHVFLVRAGASANRMVDGVNRGCGPRCSDVLIPVVLIHNFVLCIFAPLREPEVLPRLFFRQAAFFTLPATD
jgi:hypothetical protein